MDQLEKWFWEQASTTTGSLVLFLLVFVARISIDQYSRKRDRRREPRRKKGIPRG